MSPEEGSDQKPAPEISAILNQMWVRFLPAIYERIDVLEAAGRAHAAGNLTSEQCQDAHATAHKLVGTLGTFGLMHGTELAREFEQACANDETAAATDTSRLEMIASEIRKMVDERK